MENKKETIGAENNIVTIGKDGSVQLPKHIIKKWNLKPNSHVTIEQTNTGIMLLKKGE